MQHLDEYESLDEETKTAVDVAIALVEAQGIVVRRPHRNGEVYAHPHPGGGVSWGVNGGEFGFCIARGVRK